MLIQHSVTTEELYVLPSIIINTVFVCIIEKSQNQKKNVSVVLSNMFTILVMSAKLAATGFLKVNVFLNKCYKVSITFLSLHHQIPLHHVTNILQNVSIYIADMFKSPKFCNSHFYEKSYHNFNFISI